MAFNVAVVSAKFTDEAELIDGRAVVEFVPVVKRDSNAPCIAKLLLSAAVASIRAVYRVFPDILEEGA